MLSLNYYCPHCGWSGTRLIPECEINKPKWTCCKVCLGKALLVYPNKVEIKADEVYKVCDNNSEDIDSWASILSAE